MIAIGRHRKSAELRAIERVVVVIELQEGHASLAVFEKTVFEGSFRECLALVGMVFQDRGIGKAPKCQLPMDNFRLKSLRGLVVESHPGFASSIQFKTDKS